MSTLARSVNRKNISSLPMVKDVVAMRELFQRRLPRFAEGRLQMDFLKVKYFWDEPGEQCQIFYKCFVKDLKTGRKGKQTLLGLVEPTGNSHPEYAKAGRDTYFQPEFGPAVFFLKELNMVLWGFPNDPELKALSRLMDLHKVSGLFLNHWNSFHLPPGVTLKSVRTTPIKYVPQSRCTLRHDLLLQGCDDLTIYSKTFNQKTDAGLIFKVMHTLWNASNDRGWKITVPEPLFLEPEMNTLFVRGLEGKGVDEDLSEIDLDKTCEEIGAGLAGIHQCDIEGLPSRPDDRIAMKISEAREVLENSSSAHSARVDAIAEALEEKYPGLTPVPQTPTHGAFRISQLLWADDKIALIDFDEFLLGNPVSDVGGFVASLLFYSLEDKITSEQCLSAIRRFCRAYAGHAPWGLPEDVLEWETTANLVGKHAKKCINRPKKRGQNIVDQVLTLAENILTGKLRLK